MGRKFLFFINIVFVLATVVLIGLGHVAPSRQDLLLGGTLLVPGLLTTNALFVLFWLVKLDKRSLLSIALLISCYSYENRLFAIDFSSTTTNKTVQKMVFKVASFNVLHYHGQQLNNTSNNCFSLFNQNEVDFFGVQEANIKPKNSFYPHTNYSETHFSQSWILSKYPIVASKALDISFGRHTSRRSITYADVLLKRDTVRVFNLHFESYRFSKDADKLQKQGLQKFRSTVGNTFKIHEKEVNKLIKYIKRSPYPVIVMGDFNNNAYSYEYNQLINQCNLKDTFVAAGNGFGATFNFNYFPTRIDFILVPDSAKVYSHQVIQKKEWSDHYPIIAEISL